MMHRFFLPGVAALALALAVPAPVEAGGGGGGLGGGGHGGIGLSLGGGDLGHAGVGLNPVGGGVGHGATGYGLGSGRSSIGTGGSRAPIGLGLTKGIGTPGGDDLHLGLSSRELGLGNNFGLDAPDNVLDRAVEVPTSPLVPGLGGHAYDRFGLQGPDSSSPDRKNSGQGISGNDGRSLSPAKDSAASDKAGGINFKKLDRQQGGSGSIEALDLLTQESKLQANVPQPPAPPTPAPTTAPSIQQGGPTLPEDSTVVTTSLGSGEVQMIGAYFAENGAPIASIPTSSVNVSVGGTVPDSVALFPPPYDLASQLSDDNFLYFVWGNDVVIVDGQTNVVTGIVPDVLAHQS